jgi:hypothetical protein
MTASDEPGSERDTDDLLRGGSGEHGIPGDPETDADLLNGGTASPDLDRVGAPADRRLPRPEMDRDAPDALTEERDSSPEGKP